MLRRILMAFLIACLAGPAVAMPMESKTQTVASGHCQEQAPASDERDTGGVHGCIGCLAPFRVEIAAQPPMALPAIPAVPALTAQRLHARDAPEPPPPRG